jgi:hypothetical protein
VNSRRFQPTETISPVTDSTPRGVDRIPSPVRLLYTNERNALDSVTLFPFYNIFTIAVACYSWG